MTDAHLQKAVFLDRDGVVIETRMRGTKPVAALSLSEVKILPGARNAVERLCLAGYSVFIITNQPDIARGNLSFSEAEKINKKVVEELGGISRIRRLYMCPHDAGDRCACRKPRAGMIFRAAQEFGIDPMQSALIGDRSVDIEAGTEAGCRTVILHAPYNVGVEANYRALDLEEAVSWIINSYK